MRKPILLALAALAVGALPAGAQATIRAGMTAEQVRAAFGAPARTRDQDDWTYWFYSNGCPVRCGSDDVVFMQGGKVVAAVLRTGSRQFDGPAASASLASVEGLPPERGLVRVPAAAHRTRAARRPSSTRRAPAPARTTSNGRTTTTVQGGRTIIRGTPATVGGVTVTETPRQGSAAAGGTVQRQGAPAQANPRTAITGQPTTIVGTGGAGAASGTAAPGVARRGSRAVGDSAALRTNSDSSTDQRRLDREKRVTPRVVPTQQSGIQP